MVARWLPAGCPLVLACEGFLLIISFNYAIEGAVPRTDTATHSKQALFVRHKRDTSNLPSIVTDDYALIFGTEVPTVIGIYFSSIYTDYFKSKSATSTY